MGNNSNLQEYLNTQITNITNRQYEYIFLRKAHKIKKVFISDIIYITVEERYCTLITNKEKFTIQISLNKIKLFFEKCHFIRTHRNTIINPNKIVEITLKENSIILEGNHHVVLSDKYKNFLDTEIIF